MERARRLQHVTSAHGFLLHPPSGRAELPTPARRHARAAVRALRIAGVNVLLAPARIVISTPWAIRPGHVLLKTLQTLV
jgi:hypothetical protein